MIGAIIQAIDHAMERAQRGMSAGIDVANSQHGGAAGYTATSNGQVDTSKTGENIKSAASEATQQGLSAKVGGSAESRVSESADATKGSDALPKGSDATKGSGALPSGSGVLPSGSGVLPSGSTSAASSILSDQEAKEAKSISAKTAATNTVSSWKKARNYGTNVSKGFANAGAIATGQGKQYDTESPSIVDFDITKDFKAEPTNIKKSK